MLLPCQVDNYNRLADLVLEGQCSHISRDSVRPALNDLCWAHLQNRLGQAQPAQWHALFGKLVAGGLVQGDCACCMQARAQAAAQCKWSWPQKCAGLSLKVQ